MVNGRGVVLLAAVLTAAVSTRFGARAAQPASQQAPPMHAELVAQMINWTTDPRVADQVNPFRGRVVALGEAAVPALLARLADASPLSDVVGALGEIGSRRAFPGLLAKYLLTPSDNIAVSLGSTFGKAEIIYLRDSDVLAPDALAKLLGVMLGTPGRPVTGRSAEELWETAFDDLAGVRSRCMTRSRPMPG